MSSIELQYTVSLSAIPGVATALEFVSDAGTVALTYHIRTQREPTGAEHALIEAGDTPAPTLRRSGCRR